MAVFNAVLRIHLILMWIRILDPHWKKMYPDLDPSQNISLRFTDFFLQSIIVNLFFFFFSLSFMLEHERFRDQEFF